MPGRTSDRSILIRKSRWDGGRCCCSGTMAGGSWTSAINPVLLVEIGQTGKDSRKIDPREPPPDRWCGGISFLGLRPPPPEEPLQPKKTASSAQFHTISNSVTGWPMPPPRIRGQWEVVGSLGVPQQQPLPNRSSRGTTNDPQNMFRRRLAHNAAVAGLVHRLHGHSLRAKPRPVVLSDPGFALFPEAGRR